MIEALVRPKQIYMDETAYQDTYPCMPLDVMPQTIENSKTYLIGLQNAPDADVIQASADCGVYTVSVELKWNWDAERSWRDALDMLERNRIALNVHTGINHDVDGNVFYDKTVYNPDSIRTYVDNFFQTMKYIDWFQSNVQSIIRYYISNTPPTEPKYDRLTAWYEGINLLIESIESGLFPQDKIKQVLIVYKKLLALQALIFENLYAPYISITAHIYDNMDMLADFAVFDAMKNELKQYYDVFDTIEYYQEKMRYIGTIKRSGDGYTRSFTLKPNAQYWAGNNYCLTVIGTQMNKYGNIQKEQLSYCILAVEM